ncbi:MAG: AAA family ATPase, partial [Caldilineaceae bacterium]|nr:AAA family ATPase [Caldilineaceae bacterium]
CTPITLTAAGEDRRIDAHRVDRRLRHPQKTRGLPGMSSPMIGRDLELAELRRLFDQVQHGQGQLVLVTGEPGIGKTRLLDELHARLRHDAAGVQWLAGRCQEMGASSSFWPMRDLLRSLVAQRDDDEQSAVLGLVEWMVESGVLSLTQRAAILPALAYVSGIRLGDPWDTRHTDMEPEAVRTEVVDGLRCFVSALARQRPTVLVLEDLHWADTLSLDLFIQLMDDVADLPLLLVGVYRPDAQHRVRQMPTAAAQHCPGCWLELPLRRLAPAQTRQLLHNLLAADALPAVLEEHLLAQSAGNPLYLEESVRNMLESQALVRSEDGWIVDPPTLSAELADSLHIIMSARVDRLAPACRDLLRQMAVLGQRFPLSLAAALYGVDFLPADLLDPLVEHGFIYQERSYPEPVFAFAHALIQQSLYRNLLEKQRRALHGAAAAALENRTPHAVTDAVVALSHHWEESADPARAVPYLLQAAEKARLAYANDEAVTYYQRARSLQEKVGDRKGAARTWMALGLTYLNAHDYGRSQAA